MRLEFKTKRWRLWTQTHFSLWILICSITIILGFTRPAIDISPKVLSAFQLAFKNVNKVRWYVTEKECVAYFDEGNIKTNIHYNKEGQFLSSTRYYGQQNLPLNIFLKIKNRFKGTEVTGVTEYIVNDIVFYTINLENHYELIVVESTTDGSLTVKQKRTKDAGANLNM